MTSDKPEPTRAGCGMAAFGRRLPVAGYQLSEDGFLLLDQVEDKLRRNDRVGIRVNLR